MKERIEPHKVTKPIQLLAAWLLGLILVDGSFLSAAAVLKQPQWLPALLVVAAVCNVPVFLVSLFILQTRFRPEMQEDSYYSKYLEVQKTTRKPESLAADIQVLRSTVSESNTRTVEVIERLQTQVIEIAKQISSGPANGQPVIGPIREALEAGHEDIQERKREIEWQAYRVSVNDLLPRYSDIVSRMERVRIPVTETFGSDSADPRPPAHYVLAFGEDVAAEPLQQLLLTLDGTGVEYLDFATDEWDRGRLYVGSYGYENTPLLRLDEEAVQTVMNSKDIQQIISLVSKSPARS